jgi:hypothetical protein
MRRTAAVFGLLAVLGLLAWTWAHAAPIADARDKADAAPKYKADGPAAKLAERFDFSGIEDNKMTLQEALNDLGKLRGVVFTLNARAFDAEGTKDPAGALIADPKPLPPRKNVRLDEVLNEVLARIPTQSGAGFLVRRDRVEVTTYQALRTEVWGEGFTGPFLPLVNLKVEKTPLDEALNALADEADFNVVLDRRAADKASAVVSARFRNVPLDDAVRLLADMADLKAVHRDNVLLVTTPERAAALNREFDKERPRGPAPAVGLGGLLLGPGALGGLWPRFGGLDGFSLPGGLAPGFGGLGGCGGPLSPDSAIDPLKWRKGSGHPHGFLPNPNGVAGM